MGQLLHPNLVTTHGIRKDIQDVRDYPNDFNSMKLTDIELLSKRGEQLTEVLIKTYHPNLTVGICGK